MAKSKPTRGRRSKKDTVGDEVLTVDQLAKLSLEVLRLKCQDLGVLTTGKRIDLAERIHDKHHPTTIDPPPSIDIGDDDLPLSNLAASTSAESTIAYDGVESRTLTSLRPLTPLTRFLVAKTVRKRRPNAGHARTRMTGSLPKHPTRRRKRTLPRTLPMPTRRACTRPKTSRNGFRT